ncbi:NEL domain-containing protein [Pseudomonas sp. TNT2022 ID681]|uniref:RING-type E3 ubiquitin transferase n=1 Tax=Pseudomonas fontis TaxID=2942633 RepID=A0ABT5NYF0_9PSED|nr:DUF6543 domain-containing protein [Pseudomonas fontis]MDD0993203.1 NEL domain-containing protein [Pseudomonas fontis]
MPTTPSALPTAQSIIESRIPQWLLEAPLASHQRLRQAGGQPLPWLEQARVKQPALVRQLEQACALHHFNEQQLRPVLEALPALEAFAEPRLKAAIKQRFGLEVDVNQAYLFAAARVSIYTAYTDQTLELKDALKAATQTLLRAALQNFEDFEAAPAGLDGAHGQKAAVFAASPVRQGMQLDAPQLAIAPHEFAALCRELDLGGQYQTLIETMLNPPGQGLSLFNRASLFAQFEYSAFTLQVHLARLQGTLSAPLHQALLKVALGQPTELDGDPLQCRQLTLWGVELIGVVVVAVDWAWTNSKPALVVYLPDDPVAPLAEYPSLQHFHDALRERFLQPGYLKFFKRFVPARKQAALFQHIQEAFYPVVWNSVWRVYERELNRSATLRLREYASGLALLEEMFAQKRMMLKDDAAFHAVPTATEDAKTRADRLRYLANVLFDVLNVAAFVVPGLGTVMMGVMAVQLTYEVFEGIDSLLKGEREQAWGYLMDVAQNLAIGVGIGAGIAVAGRIAPLLAPQVLGSMRKVSLPDGTTRLWKPDLAPFAHSVPLPAELTPDAQGLYRHQGKLWLPLDGRTYEVTAGADKDTYHLVHPTGAQTYQPELRPLGDGTWLQVMERPLPGQALALFRHLGQIAQDLSDEQALKVLQVSGTDEALLRRAVAEQAQPPALLLDTLQRFSIDRALAEQEVLGEISRAQRIELFAEHYGATQAAATPEAAVVLQQFKGLPVSIAEQLLMHAAPQERAQLREAQRLPLRIAEQARKAAQRVRLARAYEGLYLDSLSNPDSERLRLDAAWQQGQLPSRKRARALLQMQPLDTRYQPPVRLSDGRLGYPLSGRGAGAEVFARDTLIDRLGQLELGNMRVQDVLDVGLASGRDYAQINTHLDRLLEEQPRFQASMDAWAHANPQDESLSPVRRLSRQRVAAALTRHWQNIALAELGYNAQPLALEGICLEDFPAQLPPFIYARTRALVLRDSVMPTAETLAGHLGVESTQLVMRVVERFPQLGAFTLEQSSAVLTPYVGLSLRLTQALPELESLSLTGLGLLFGTAELDLFRGLARLRRLDLSGNRLTAMATNFSGLNLAYLGLADMALARWPDGLDSAALQGIDELTLARNQLAWVPEFLFRTNSEGGTRTRVLLQGNPLNREMVLRSQVTNWSMRPPRFTLDVPLALEPELQQLRQERTLAVETLGYWVDPASTVVVLEDAQIASRRRTAQMLMEFWHRSAAGPGVPMLHLDAEAVRDFPQFLPRAFMERVRFVEIAQGSAAELDQVLPVLAVTESLRFVGEGQVLSHLPASLRRLTALHTLDFTGLNQTVNQAALRFFGRLPALNVLILDGNLLGDITDASLLAERRLELLGLNNMGLQAWPAWVERLLPGSVESLNLADNQLTSIPEYILANPASEQAHTDIDLRNNPLDPAIVAGRHLSNSPGRAFTVELDGVAEESASTSESDDSDEERPVTVEPWLQGQADHVDRYRAVWLQVEVAADAEQLLAMIDRLRFTADYRSGVNRGELIERVWRVLEAVAEDTALRQTLNGMAQEPLRLHGEHQTCPDGLRLEFNQMEVQVYIGQALRDAPQAQRGTALYQLSRRLYRLHELDSLAREAAAGRDEAEVRLAYRLHWSTELDLPLPPRRMLFGAIANVSAGELSRALVRVRQGEGSEAFYNFAIQQDFWAAYLRETYAQQFNALTQEYRTQVMDLYALYPDENLDQLGERTRELEARHQQRERSLLVRLTVQEGLH